MLYFFFKFALNLHITTHQNNNVTLERIHTTKTPGLKTSVNGKEFPWQATYGLDCLIMC